MNLGGLSVSERTIDVRQVYRVAESHSFIVLSLSRGALTQPTHCTPSPFAIDLTAYIKLREDRTNRLANDLTIPSATFHAFNTRVYSSGLLILGTFVRTIQCDFNFFSAW